MKRLIANLAPVLVLLCCIVLSAHAAPLREARVTQVVSDVKLLPERAQPRPASVNDMVRDGTAVRTGTQSRSELTFSDRTMTRLGQNTIFSFRGEPAPPAEGPDLSFEAPSHLTRSAPSSRATGSRVMHLDEGAMLLQVPKGVGGATIQSPVVTAAVTGTTGVGESHAASESNPKPIAKWFCLEGHIIVKLNDGSNRSVQLSAGQMVVSDGTTLPQPRYFDIAALVNTSPLFNPRPASWDLIQQEMQNQLNERMAGTFVDSTTMASLDPNTMAGTIDQAMMAQESPSPTSTPPNTPTPTPTTPTPTPMTPTPTPMTPTPTPTTPTPTPPSKFGALAVITSPDPFVIDGTTIINTDPTITSAVTTTDLGKIYRSSGMDGSRTTWLFGSTSAFDNASGFDHGAASAFLNNIAGFKFQNLILASDPTIDTTSGVTNLALVGVNGITTGSFPSTFTFAGIDTLLLATQSGSIDLLSDYTFDGPSRIFIYARGAGSHLTIGSNISAGIDLHLFSEGAVTISGALTTTHFSSFSNGDFKNAIGVVTANDFSVTSQAGSINITTNSFRPGSSNISLSLVAGGAINIRMGSDLSLFASASSISMEGSGINLRTRAEVLTMNLNVMSPATFTAGAGGISAPNINFMTTGGLELRSDGDIDIYGADIPLVNGHRTISGIINAGGDFHAVSNVTTGAMTVNGNIAIDNGDLSVTNLSAGSTFEDMVNVAGNISASQAITAAGTINANNVTAGTTINLGGALYAGNVSAGGNITVGTDPGTDDNPNFDRDIIATRVTSGGSVNAYGVAVPTLSAHGDLIVGDDGIFPYVDPNVGADLQHTITANSVTSSGGIFFISALYGGINGLSHGGLLTINAHNILFDDGSQGIGFTDLDGANVGDFNGAVSEAGDGGRLIVRTTGNITATADTIIIARTGFTPPDLPFGGAGGHVTLDSSGGEVSFDGLIRVSAYAPFESHGDPQRRSSSGGFITLHSGLTSGMAIDVGENAALQAFLGDEAPGPGGLIQLISEGGDIVANGQLEADHGSILITNLGSPGRPHGNTSTGSITLNGAGLTASTLEISSGRDLNIGLNTSVDFNANSALTLSATNAMHLGDFVSTSFVTDVIGDVLINAGSITANSILIDRISGGQTQGINISMQADNNISVATSFQITADNSFSNIGDGVNISLDAGSVATRGLNLTVANNSGFLSGAGGNMAVLIGGNFSANTINALVNNSIGGFIGSGGNMDFNISGNLTTTHAATFLIDNHQGGSLGDNVLLGVGAAGISVGDTLTARIDNSDGSISGEAKIDLHAGEATVGADAAIEILGSDGADSATINIGAGNYDAGGTFRTYIDGNGTIGLSNASIHGDVLKVGALGANGVLNIGGGTLSADTTLKLYASGSNGQLNFISDVTLGGNSEKILAANSVTIFDGVTVTIGGPNAASVFTNNANYTGFGGNDSTTGTFSGAGANDPAALDQAPPFDESPRPPATPLTQQPKPNNSSPSVPKKGRTTIMVVDSGQLNSLLDRPASGANTPSGKPVTDRAPGDKHSGRNNGAGRSNTGRTAETNPRMAAIPARNL